MKLCGFEIGLDKPFFLIAGPCVIESRQLAIDTAGALKEMTSELGIPFIYKSSYDKANRSSSSSFRGPGMEKGLDILADVKKQFNIPVLTDVHTESEIVPVARTVDVLQTPAFLCRQTDFIQAMRSLSIMRKTGCPVVFDATHSVQLPGGLGDASGGQREFVPVLARAAIAVGVAGLFMETHPNPAEAKSDGPNAVPLDRMKELLTQLVALDKVVRQGNMSSFTF